MPSLQSLEEFRTSLGEMVETIQEIRGKRYGMMLTTLFNIWGLGGISAHALGTTDFAAIILEDAMETMMALFLGDVEEKIDPAVWAETGDNLEKDLMMLVKKQQEFEIRNRSAE